MFKKFLLYCFITLFPLFAFPSKLAAETPNRSWEETYDKQNIRHSSGMVTDTSADVLKLPSVLYSYPSSRDFTIATTPPTIEFGIPQLVPEYLSSGGPYGGWAKSSYGPDGNFYFSIGNHNSFAADAFLFQYNPQSKIHTRVLSTKQVAGWKDSDYGDGKLHGEPDIAPNGDLWLLTFWGPEPSLSDFGTRYFGGHLIYYNVVSKKNEYLGRPLADDSWPVHKWDWQRNRLYAVGEWSRYYGSEGYGKFLVYDTANRKVIFGGLPKSDSGQEIHWYHRAMLLDRETGIVYGTESSSPYRFVSYNPSTNKFSFMNARLTSPIRAWPDKKNTDGSFWIFDYNGNIYKFFPHEDRVEQKAKNWMGGTYIADMELSPSGKYFYYPVASISSDFGMPIVQYNTETNTKKVIAFLSEYYHSRYGYGIQGSYALSLSADGSSLFVHVNGIFCPGVRDKAYGRPAIFHIKIPASERVENIPSPSPTPTSSPGSKPGDANGDGKVTGTDYIIWIDKYGISTIKGYSDADFNLDGKVTGLDYIIWVDNYGA